ncbi:LPS-assembly protein LptD [Gimesia panareensis]|nr:LPS-assembly protein LptD [Gimesia panareensis]
MSGEIYSVSRYVSLCIWRVIVSIAILGGVATVAPAQTSFFGAPKASYEESEYEPSEQEPIEVEAEYSQAWEQDFVNVSILKGNCQIKQGDAILRSRQMVIWHAKSRKTDRISVYLEGEVRVDLPGESKNENSLLVNLVTQSGLKANIRRPSNGVVAEDDPLLKRATQRRGMPHDHQLKRAQFIVEKPPLEGPELAPAPEPELNVGFRRIRLFPRSAVPYNVQSFPSTHTVPPEQIWVITGGVNLLIDGVEGLGMVDMSADRIIIWTDGRDTQNFNSEIRQSKETPFEIYLEGNIEIRQGTYYLKANRAFYDAREERGVLLDAELKTYLPTLGEDVRVRASQIRQLSKGAYLAQNAWATGSQFGKPGYKIQSSDVFIEDRYTTPWLGTGSPDLDPVTGEPVPNKRAWLSSSNNTFEIGNIPLFYLPYVTSPAEDIYFPITGLRFGNDRIFGFQTETEWDMYKLLGLERLPGTKWEGQLDYYSYRGVGIGQSGTYEGANLLGFDNVFKGDGEMFYIHDTGLDNLGADRRALIPSTKDRYFINLHHRQESPFGMTLTGEGGLLSDRNFLNEYFENTFETGKDVETLLHLKQQQENWSWSVIGRTRLNGFTTTTDWLPKADLFLLGEPLLGNRLNWTSHSSVGYGKLKPGSAPYNPSQDVFTPLPYVADSQGLVAMTRNQLEAPFNLGPIIMTPYVMGEAAYWEQGLQQQQIDRLYGSAGLRSSIMAERIFPDVYNPFFNLNGLAHKMVLEADYSFSDSSENLNNIAQYNEFDDNAQERFRERLVINTFGGTLPPQFDPRFYAVRTGAGRGVTDPYYELVDDQQVLRMAWRHRLQTKTGPPDQQRIKDWMTLDLEASYFPDAQRDNFGEDFGLLGGRYRWFLGDRTTLAANAYYDLFDGAQQLWDVSLTSQRTRRMTVNVALQQIKGGGGLDSRILSATLNYVMSEKWSAGISTAYDLGENMNRGQILSITRTGADFVMSLGMNYNQSTGNAGIGLTIMPRFGNFGAGPGGMSSLFGNPTQ